jgi:hypothetical protein
MDHRQFDRLTRRLASPGDRRGLLRLGLTMLASLPLPRVAGAAAAQEGCPGDCPADQVCVNGGCFRPCITHRDCRSKKKDDPCMSNTCVNGVCLQAIIDCQPGYECCQGECCPTSCMADADCAVADPCRWGRCGAEGVCVFTVIDPCPVCVTSDDCQSSAPNTFCCDGVCQRPCPEGTIMGKGCECRADSSAVLDGLVVRDDASGETPDR